MFLIAPSTVITQQSLLVRWVIIFLYAAVIGIAIAYHEPWRDETHAWLIVQYSDSLSNLFVNKAYEGHPSLWYLLLYATNYLGKSFTYVQILHWAIATAVVYLLIMHAPFRLSIKILLVFSYFLSYEYAVIARNYAVGILLLFAVCSLFQFRHQAWGYVTICILLAVLFQASVLSIIIGASLYGIVGLELIIFRRAQTLNHWLLYSIGAIVIIIGLVFSLITLIPPPDMGFPYPVSYGHDYGGIVTSLAGIWNALVPLPSQLINFWNTNILDPIGYGPQMMTVKSVLMLGVIGLVLLPLFRSWLGMAGWLLSCLFLFYILFEYYVGSLRHYGHFIISLLVFLWVQPLMADYESPWRPVFLQRLTPMAQRLWPWLLTVQVLAAGIALGVDLLRPFSMNETVANYIRSGPQRNWFRAGEVDHSVEGVAAYLPDFRMYYPKSMQQDGFIRWTNLRKDLTLEQVMDSVHARQTGPTLLILTLPVEQKIADSLKLRPIRSFTGSIVWDEQYWLYQVNQ